MRFARVVFQIVLRQKSSASKISEFNSKGSIRIFRRKMERGEPLPEGLISTQI
jgi:hypothetical protein